MPRKAQAVETACAFLDQNNQACSKNAVSDGQRRILLQSKQESRRNTLCISRLTCEAMRQNSRCSADISVFGVCQANKNRPETLPVSVSTATRRDAGSAAVPGIMEMGPAMGHRNLAPPYSRMSRMVSIQPVGTPFLVGSSDRDRWGLTIMVQ